MQITTRGEGERAVALITGLDAPIGDAQTALDFFMSAQYTSGCSRMALAKEAFDENFYVLNTRLAGEILQKCINYNIKLAIFGDFTGYTSKALRDFMRESNRGHDIFFTATAEEAVDRLLDQP